jgi:hypothetical protein
MTSTGTNTPLVEIYAYEEIGVTIVNEPLPMRAETTITVRDDVSVDDDVFWEWSDYESDPNVDWHGGYDELGDLVVWYEKPIHIIGFRPEKGKKFISENNDSELFLIGIKGNESKRKQ